MASSTMKQQKGGKRLLYKVKSSKCSDGSLVYSVFSCVDDIEHHRHRRNPFDPKYIQAALSTFEVVRRATREEVEAGSTNVHLRVELIKSMKDGLVKITSEAVKHCNTGGLKKSLKKGKDIEGIKPQIDTEKPGGINGFAALSFEKDVNKYEENGYVSEDQKRKAGLLAGRSLESLELGIAQVVKEMEGRLSEYTNFLEEDELCFNLKKETMELPLNGSLRRQLYRRVEECLEEGDCGDLSPFKGYISPITKDLVLDNEYSEDDDMQSAESPDKQNTQLKEAESGCIHAEMDAVQTSPEMCVDESCIDICGAAHPVQCSNAENFPARFPEGINVAMFAEIDTNKIPMKANHPISRNKKGEKNNVQLKHASKTCASYDSMELLSDDEAREEDTPPVDIQDDIEDEELANMDVDMRTCFMLQDEVIDKLLECRRQYKRGRNLWFVQNPEKLLLPVAADPRFDGEEVKLEGLTDCLLVSNVTSANMFREALSKPGLDLVLRYNAVRGDPSKIPGALHFHCSAAAAPHECPSRSTDDVIVQDPTHFDGKKYITDQRYFIALLSLVHQQNMGSLKDISLGDMKIVLESSPSGKLNEIIICLVPLQPN